MLYLDHNSTTIIDSEVRQLMINLATGIYNPSSTHANGRAGKKIIEHARRQVAKSVNIDINFKEYQIIFTSSGTESNNLIMSNYYDGEIFISAIEHLSIFNHMKYVSNIQIIKVDNNGIVDLENLEQLLATSNSSKKLVSVMLANNETGVIQNMSAIVKITKQYGAAIHSDCVQCLGKIPLNIKELELDFVTISSHKIGGGSGSAALIARSKYILKPMMIGGGQEKNIRSGTENIVAIACFGLATSIVTNELSNRQQQMEKLQSSLERNLLKYKNVKIVGQNVARLPNTSLIVVPKTDAQIKLIALDLRNIAVSSGSACSSGKVDKSHVLTAMGMSDEEARSSIRISLSYSQTEEDVAVFVREFEEIYAQELI